MAINPIELPVFPLTCSSCGKESLKSLIELEVVDKFTCKFCGFVIDSTKQYRRAHLEEFLKQQGYSGFILRKPE